MTLTHGLRLMNKRSIAFQIGLYVLTAVVIIISLIVFINYKHSRKILMDNIEEGAIHQSSLIINQITRNVVNTQEITRNVANQVLYYQAHDDLDFFLYQVVKTNQVTNGLHVKLFFNTDSITYSAIRNEKGDVELRENYQFCSINRYPEIVGQAIQHGKGMWSKPFYCPRDSSALMISYFLPVWNESKEVTGIIAGDISLKFLNHVISNIQVGTNGFAFIVSKEGLYLTHPRQAWVMKRNIFEIDSTIFNDNRKRYRQLLVDGETASGFAYPQMFGYQKAWFYFSPVPYTDWRVIFVIPTNELFNDLDVMLKEILIVSFIGILLILFIIIIIFNRLFSPLVQAVKSIQRFSFGEWGKQTKSRKNEIELLNESLQELQMQYGSYMKEQLQIKKDKRKYEKDLKSAKEIQRTIIPQDYRFLETHQEIDLYAILQPAESIGGDLYDFFFIDEKHLLFTMGDVSGKGIPAALFMAVASTMIKTQSTNLSAKNIVDVVNKSLSKENSNQHFLTLFLGILDIETGILDYCNAAHNYPFLLSKNKKVIQLEQTHGLPIGVYFNKTYKSHSIVLAKDDVLVLYTDGVTDCKNERGELYGMNRLSEFMNSQENLSPKALIEVLMNELQTFKGKAEQADDISVMAMKFNGKYT